MKGKTVILSVGVDNVTPEEALDRAMGFLNGEGSNLLLTPNPEMIMLANKEIEFMDIMNKAELVTPDGIGVVIASRMIGGGIKKRVTGCDLVQEIFKKISDRKTGHSVYLYGATPGVALAAEQKLRETYPFLNVVGSSRGYLTPDEERIMLDEIIEKKPDILVIAMNMMQSEKWAEAHRYLPVKLITCTGGTIDILGGKVKRAPKAFRMLGLEWLYRLLCEPKRARRMLVLPVFIVKVLLKDVFKRKG